MDSITADVLTAVIKDVMLRLNLAITKLRGQCYDGCSTMSGCCKKDHGGQMQSSVYALLWTFAKSCC